MMHVFYLYHPKQDGNKLVHKTLSRVRPISLYIYFNCSLHASSHGEVQNERGRTVFEMGFARTRRKVMGG